MPRPTSTPPVRAATDADSLAAHAPFGDRRSEEGSLVSEYGLVTVLGATIAGLAITWARGGAIAGLLDAVLRQVRVLVGA